MKTYCQVWPCFKSDLKCLGTKYSILMLSCVLSVCLKRTEGILNIDIYGCHRI